MNLLTFKIVSFLTYIMILLCYISFTITMRIKMPDSLLACPKSAEAALYCYRLTVKCLLLLARMDLCATSLSSFLHVEKNEHLQPKGPECVLVLLNCHVTKTSYNHLHLKPDSLTKH